MDEQQTIPGVRKPRQRHGAALAALEETLSEWRAAGHLTGRQHAAVRNLLRSSARNLDRANDDTEVSPYSRAMVLRIHNELLAGYAPDAAPVDDDLGPDPAA